jgi:phosphoesterase RecJ-like protein
MSAAALDAVEQIARRIHEQDGFILATHIHPDGDAIGSELALWLVLEQLGKRVAIINHSPTSEQFAYLPGYEQVRCLAQTGAVHTALSRVVSGATRPLLFALDCGSLDRLGDVPAVVAPRGFVNIDHHHSNDRFGELALVRADACSTGELVFDLAVACGVPIDLEIATCIYTAIVSDTGSFGYANTSPRAHDLAARLIDLGVDPVEVSRHLFRSRTLEQLRLGAMLASSMSLACDGRLAWCCLTHAMCAEAGVDPIDTQDMVLVPISVRGVELGLLFRETEVPGEIKLSLRSEGTVDASALAALFGGGGHAGAAGCAFGGAMAAVVPTVIARIERWLAGEVEAC